MKILVTGGCGYIGSATARWLRAEGHAVTVIDDLSEGHRQAWDGELCTLDLRERDSVLSWLQNRAFDGVVHFAARAYVGESVQQPLRYWRANLVPLIHLCEALEGVPIVFSSTCATYGNPDHERLSESHPQRPVNPYGATKLACERVLQDRRAAGQGAFACLRYFNAAGAAADGNHGEDHRPETHLIPLAIRAALDEGAPLIVHGSDYDTPDGSCIRDFIHIEDLARAHSAALHRLARGEDSGAWNLGTGIGSSVREILTAVEAATGRPVPFEVGPRRPGDPARLIADASLAARELDWSAQWTEREELVASAVRWHRIHPEGYTQ